jgi:3-dehydroquinate synthase
VVVDRAVLDRSDSVGENLAAVGIEAIVAAVPPGEQSKSIETASRLYDRLAEFRADRHTVIVALGGGVVGDLSGFVAATFARGLPLLMLPTTLLAQVDSSVGGKVGVNHTRGKNLIGAFHQPCGVWIDTSSLATLPDRAWKCGLAEVVKYGMILDAGFFERLERESELIRARDPAITRSIIARCCALKARIVELDEREETGLRAVLNFGHTAGHAIEAVAGYNGQFEHGEAVAVGMAIESRLAERLGWITPAVSARLISLLEKLGLPTRAPGVDAGAVLQSLALDKKNRAGRIRAVLPRAIGQVELTDEPSREDWVAVLGLLLSDASEERPIARTGSDTA